MSLSQDIITSSLYRLNPAPTKDYDCIESCFEAASSCWICVDACLNEKDNSHLKDCIKLSLRCAEVCASTARMLIFQADYSREEILDQVKACRDLLKLCSDECGLHGETHEHCFISARSALECLRNCDNFLERSLALEA